MHLGSDRGTDGIKLLDEGDIIELNEETEGTFYVEDRKQFLKDHDGKGIWVTDLHATFMIGKMKWLHGKWVVYKTLLTGGSNSSFNPHPCGHRVYCEKMDDSRVRINFYQTGGFTATICDIEPIGRAELTYQEI